MGSARLTPVRITPGTLEEAQKRYRSLPRLARQRTLVGTVPRRVYLDLETTGFDANRDCIIEVGAVVVDGEAVVEEYEALLVPDGPIPGAIQAFTGITDAMVQAEGVEPCDAAVRLSRMLNGAEVVAFNARFEEAFLAALSARTGVALPAAGFIDALELARIVLPRLSKHRQVDLCELLGIEVEPAHRALTDARALAALYPMLLGGLEAMDTSVRAAVVALSPSTDWPLRRLFGTAGMRPDLVRWRRSAPRVRRFEWLSHPDDVILRPVEAEEVEAAFGHGGALEASGYAYRVGQLSMARAVAAALSSGEHLVVEAGTGTGKSAAYLVPALMFAARNGVRVVVSTHTTALQDQLIEREIPRVAEALGLEVRAVVLKGYDHYLCLRRFAQLWEGEELSRSSLPVAAMLTSWVADSEFDELGSLNLHSLGELDALVRAGQASCLKERCRFAKEGSCFMWGQRRRAQAAHVLVVNHALLLANARFSGALYPSSRHVIVDEAHQLAKEARDALTLRMSRQRIGQALGDLAGRGRGGLSGRLLASLRSSARVAERGGAVSSAAGRAARNVRRLFDAVKDMTQLPGPADGAVRTLRISEAVREAASWGAVAASGGDALDSLSEVIHGLRVLRDELAGAETAVASHDAPDAETATLEALADVDGWIEELGAAASALEAALQGADDGTVVWVEVQRRADWQDEVLCAAPIDVGERLFREFFEAHDCVVCTSATLDAGDGFRHFVREVGLDRGERTPRLLELASPFDFASQMAVLAVTDLPEPTAEGYLKALCDLTIRVHRAAKGGTLTLFTRRSDMLAVHAAVEPVLAAEGLPVLCQGSGAGRRRLAEEFRLDPKASLMATRSFWEGFDAPGDTLRAVLIAKLPFGHWGDPVAEALRDIDPGRFWSDHYLPEAVIELKQAAGRLIRSPKDRGVVVLADSRLDKRRYGSRFISALPSGSAVFATGDEAVSAIERFFQ